MRVTLVLDDALLAKARAFSGHNDVSALVHEALRDWVALESTRRLARLGGSEPDLTPSRRRRDDAGQ